MHETFAPRLYFFFLGYRDCSPPALLFIAVCLYYHTPCPFILPYSGLLSCFILGFLGFIFIRLSHLLLVGHRLASFGLSLLGIIVLSQMVDFPFRLDTLLTPPHEGAS